MCVRVCVWFVNGILLNLGGNMEEYATILIMDKGVIHRGCSPYHISMAVRKGLGRLVHVPSRCWEATCGWG